MKGLVISGFFLVLVLFSLPGSALADEWLSPEDAVLHSPNGLYTVRIVPGHSVGDAIGFDGAEKGRYAEAVLTGPEVEGERAFGLLNPVAPVDALVLDDGSLITFDNWHNMGYGKMVVFYDRAGKMMWAQELEDLLSEERLRLVPHSVSSRWWRKSPLEWTLEPEGVGAETITVTLWNEDRLAIRLADGQVEYAPVADPGSDPLAPAQPREHPPLP